MKAKDYIVFFICLFSVLAIFFVNTLSEGIEVKVSNNSGELITKIKLVYSGGSQVIDSLNDKKGYTVYVNPKTDSHLEIEFLTNQNQKVKEVIDVYFAPNYSGQVFINVGNNFIVSWKDDVHF